jgi:hypothetical protein
VLTVICCGPFGVFSFIGLSSTKKAERLYQMDSANYSGYKNVKTGKILCYWIGNSRPTSNLKYRLFWCYWCHSIFGSFRKRFLVGSYSKIKKFPFQSLETGIFMLYNNLLLKR